MEGAERILVDKEKVIIDGAEAYRLYFYDVMEGVIIKVISFVALEDIYLNRPVKGISENEEVQDNIEVLNAIQRN